MPDGITESGGMVEGRRPTNELREQSVELVLERRVC
jgi:hypothetical protein